LVGRWEGTGWATSKGTFEVKPGPGVPGGKDTFDLKLTSHVEAEFRSDGTYTWNDHLTGGGLTLTIEFPKAGEPAPHWEVVGGGAAAPTLRLANGEFDLQFQGRDEFVLRYKGTDSTSETTFRRKP
jgi:hypothetical protein